MAKNYPVVILPGHMCDQRAYRPQIDYLQKNHVVQIADLTAHDDIASMAKNTLRNAPDEFILLGHSMGSITALELLRQAEPNRVKAAILMSVNPRNETLERKAGREKVMEEVEKTSVQQIIRKKFAPIYFHGDRPNLRSLSIKMAVDLGPEVMNRQATALMKRPNNVPFLNALQIPVLIIGGEHDSLVPVATLKNTARKIPNAELIILNDAAHFPGLERPEITNNIIGTWITQVENRG